jgi:hypothetical protein
MGAANLWRYIMDGNQTTDRQRVPWNKDKLVGQKAPFKPKDVWATRARMEREHRTRELALMNLGIDSKLRGCDLGALNLGRGTNAASRCLNSAATSPSAWCRRVRGT